MPELESVEFKNDHDILVMIVGEVRRAREDIRDLNNGTSNRMANSERRIECLENWKSERISAIKSTDTLMKFLIGIGILILSILVWHLTGYKI